MKINVKVLVETSALLSASIFLTAEELKVTLKHSFYDISHPLMDFLRKHVEKRIGITTVTIENEARGKLAEAVMATLIETIERDKISKLKEREKLFGLYASFCDICSDNLAHNSAILTREPILESERDQWLKKTDLFYERLKVRASVIDTEKIAHAMVKFVPPKFRKLAEKIYRKQKRVELRPITRLTGRPPSRRDKEILAEAAYLKRYYNRLGKCKFFLASTDCHFSPVGLPGRRITTLTNAIEKKFGITCNWPNEILKRLQRLKF